MALATAQLLRSALQRLQEVAVASVTAVCASNPHNALPASFYDVRIPYDAPNKRMLVIRPQKSSMDESRNAPWRGSAIEIVSITDDKWDSSNSTAFDVLVDDILPTIDTMIEYTAHPDYT